MNEPSPLSRIQLGPWDALKGDAMAIRYEVFVIEQRVPAELELDADDPLSLHAVAYDLANQAIATGRLLRDGHIGRMAVKAEARGLGVGAVVLQSLIDAAIARGDRVLMLNAQTHAAPFYERFGFAAEGEEFDDAGIAHIAMRRWIKTEV